MFSFFHHIFVSSIPPAVLCIYPSFLLPCSFSFFPFSSSSLFCFNFYSIYSSLLSLSLFIFLCITHYFSYSAVTLFFQPSLRRFSFVFIFIPSICLFSSFRYSFFFAFTLRFSYSLYSLILLILFSPVPPLFFIPFSSSSLFYLNFYTIYSSLLYFSLFIFLCIYLSFLLFYSSFFLSSLLFLVSLLL